MQVLRGTLAVLKSTSVGDGERSIVGKGAQPGKVLILQFRAAEKPQDSQHFPLKDQRLAGKTVDLLSLDPLWPLDPLVLPGPISNMDQNSLPRTADE